VANLAISDEAPAAWSVDATTKAIATKVAALGPDVVALQEAGRFNGIDGYQVVDATTNSHAGPLLTLVKDELAKGVQMSSGALEGFAVITVLGVGSPAPLAIANVHLEPFASGSDIRLEQLSVVAEVAPVDNLVVIGDTNSRVSEVRRFEGLGFKTPKPPAPTWDSIRNSFHRESRGFRAYFTRSLVKGGVSLDEQTVWNQPLQRQQRRFYLSDHFALGGSVSIV